ncbi:MAG TPA: hypothetical protein QGH03_02055 [Candidatus Paceibacterota bacterium]|jgi:hypothetical protein|nr:hypothetical protein [Candidatus Paceibacterota bacterium]HJN62992.1 hypothetical protein [Candidatus Paceibacterota bacterium]|tara:strand:- start:217 stop:540 length:324 start_codon:yes stop_codon:yes gene_type:complete
MDFSEYLNKLKRALKSLSKIFHANLYSNWVLLILIFVIINVFLISGSILEFLSISSDENLLSEENTATGLNTINRSGLDRALSDFELRNENYKDLKRNRPYFVDPSF